MAVLNVVINGTHVELPDGGSAPQGLRIAGVHVPALCHDDRLAPTGACRTCLVQVKGSPKLAAACVTPLADGMEIDTDTPELEQTRRGILEMLVHRYPADAIRRFPDRPFHQEISRAGLIDRAADCLPNHDLDRSHPYIAVDMTRCIDCYRCVRICAELQGQFVWHVRNRGRDTAIRPTARRSATAPASVAVPASIRARRVRLKMRPSRRSPRPRSGRGRPAHTAAWAVSSCLYARRPRHFRGART